ncbi:MAG: hypothetical protein PHP23_09960 [Desulfobacterales bacterium]|nr:hypothetical protein [Desulfobacterales bacterium]MDD4071734.1 hypothetical protein [Desulfobacterales bacterium]
MDIVDKPMLPDRSIISDTIVSINEKLEDIIDDTNWVRRGIKRS